MKRAFELSPRAERSFADIRTYSREQFGTTQTRRYLTVLLDRCQALAEGKVPHRSCRAYFADDLRADLRFIQAGNHYVVFIDKITHVIIVDFLHQSADIGNRLGGPPE